MKKSWKKLNSKIIHKNSWYYLREDDVIRPDGNKGKYYYIDGINSVAVIAEDNDKSIYLVGQTRYPVNNIYSWEIIGGGAEKDRDPINVAKRELKEEAGLIAQDWQEIGWYYPANCITSDKTYLFVAKKLKKVKPDPEPTEDITIKKEKISTVIKMIAKNEITCGFSITAIYKYLLYKERLQKK